MVDPLVQLTVASVATFVVAALPFGWSRGERPAWKVWWVLLWSSVLLIGAKTADLLQWKLSGLWRFEGLTRQSILAVTVGLLTALCLGSKRVRSGFLPLTGLWPAGIHLGGMISGGRWGRLTLGAIAVVGSTIALASPKGDMCPALTRSTCWSSVGFLVIGLASFVALAWWEIVRVRRHHEDPLNRPEPRRDLLWTVAIPSLLLTIAGATSILLGRPVKNSPTAELRDLLVVTAFGEELLFRGFLLAMALLATSPGRIDGVRDRTLLGFWAVSLSFGLWHVGDAIQQAVDGDWSWVATLLAVGGTVMITTLGSRFVLVPLRVRTQTLAAPVLVHFSTNASGVILRA
jgi:membrane protease YdiL (CAAX protease family)